VTFFPEVDEPAPYGSTVGDERGRTAGRV